MVSTGFKQDETYQVAFCKNGKIFCDTKRKIFNVCMGYEKKNCGQVSKASNDNLWYLTSYSW